MEQEKCNNCNEFIVSGSAFCPNCGSKIKAEKQKNVETKLNTIIFFYLSIIIFIAASYFVYENYPENFLADLSVEITFILIILIFSFFDLKAITALYKFPNIGVREYFLIFFTPILTSFTVYFAVDYFNNLVDPESATNNYAEYLYLDYPLLWTIFFVAILPPVFEELAFRGYLFNLLKKVTNDKNVIIATSFLFALVHFSFISIIWIFPFGLLLGYLRNKYKSLWLGMIIHFIHNLIIVLLDYYVFNFNLGLS